MGFNALDLLAAIEDLIEEEEIDQYDEITADDWKAIRKRAKEYCKSS